MPRAAGWVAVIGLFGLAVFFLSLGLVGRAGSDLLSNADAPVAVMGTLVASLTSIVIVPAAILIFGLGFIRETRFPLWIRGLPLATLVALLAAVGSLQCWRRTRTYLSVPCLRFWLRSRRSTGASPGRRLTPPARNPCSQHRLKQVGAAIDR